MNINVMKCSDIIWIMRFYVSSVHVRCQIKEGYHEDKLFHKAFQTFHITYTTTVEQPRIYAPTFGFYFYTKKENLNLKIQFSSAT